jgi:hypothetical protein
MISNEYEVLSCDPATVLQRLPDMGRLMLTTSRGGVTHERMGVVESVTVENGRVRIRGATHEAAIEPSSIGRVVVDRTGKMKDQVYPRVEFVGKDGETIVSAVGLDGLAPFDAGLAALGVGEAQTPPAKPESRKAELGENDPAEGPLALACEKGVVVTIAFRRVGLEQSWSGVIEAVKPAMGFVNVMRPDFHLHLRGGAIARWRREQHGSAIELLAENESGESLGLVLRGDAGVLG